MVPGISNDWQLKDWDCPSQQLAVGHGCRSWQIQNGPKLPEFLQSARNSHQNIVSVYSTWCHTLFLVSWESEWSLLGLTSTETSNARADIPWSCKCSGDFFQTDPEFKNAVTALQIGTAQMKFWENGIQDDNHSICAHRKNYRCVLNFNLCLWLSVFFLLKDSPQGVGHPRQWIINTRRSRARTKSWGTIGRTTALLAVPRCSVLTCITHPPKHPNLWTMHHTVHMAGRYWIFGEFPWFFRILPS